MSCIQAAVYFALVEQLGRLLCFGLKLNGDFLARSDVLPAVYLSKRTFSDPDLGPEAVGDCLHEAQNSK